MTSMDYDVDSMSGLMPQILALTAPPGTRDPARQQQPNGNGNGQNREGLAAHPYFRRPGRGHNHDSCDACGEGGDLICCDHCPASFHLTCHDPPLEEDEIPTGEWTCHQCRMAGNDDDRNSVSSGKSNKSTRGVKRKEDEKSAAKREDERKVCASGREFEISDSPLATLIKAAACVNPKQFSLPYELTVPIIFPGEPKGQATMRTNGSRRGLLRKRPYELDNGLVPLPAKLCFHCNKSCRIGPLIPCDFCPLFFHLDCLDPPLTTPPMGRWMCPNHPEHILDSALVTSHSLSERVRLWDRFNTAVDQDTVKLSFLQRCHRLNPPFRYKVKRALRSRIRVPASVKSHYCDPPDLLPRLYPPYPPGNSPDPLVCGMGATGVGVGTSHASCAVSSTTATTTAGSGGAPSLTLPCTTVTTLSTTTTSAFAASVSSTSVSSASVTTATSEASSLPSASFPSLDDVEVKKELPEDGHVSLPGESGIKVQETREEQDERIRPTKQEVDEWLSSLVCFQSSIAKQVIGDNSAPPPASEKRGDHMTRSQVDSLLLESQSGPEMKPGCMNGDITSYDPSSRINRYTAEGKKQGLSANSSYQLPSSYFPPGKRGILKHQRGRSANAAAVRSPKPKRHSASELLSDVLRNLALSLRESAIGKQEVRLSHLDRSIIDILAYQRLQELLTPSSPPVCRSTDPLPARALLCPLIPDVYLQEWEPQSVHSKRSNNAPVPMVYRIMNIGKGSQNDVDLSNFGHCNYVSPHHASILFDENTGHYELLNYSQYSTVVDSITYRCDLSERTVSQASLPPLLQQVRAIIEQRRGSIQSSNSQAMTSTPDQKFTRCKCRWPWGRAATAKGSHGSNSGSGNMGSSSSANQVGISLSASSVGSSSSGGWEGAAILHHGSHIRFGCLQFVFSIVEEASKTDWAEMTVAAYEKFFKTEEKLEEEVKEEEKIKEKDKETEKKIKKEEKSQKS